MLKKTVFIIPVFILGMHLEPAYALERLSNKALKRSYGQGGVRIEIDNMSIKAEIREMSYTDTDGTFDGRPATVFVSNMRTSQRFYAIKDETDRNGLLHAAYNDERIFGQYAIKSSADTRNLEINIVSELPVMTAINKYNYGSSGSSGLRKNPVASGIQVTLPTLELVSEALSFSIGIRQAGAINSEAIYFECSSTGKNVMAILRGRVEIVPH